MLMKGYDFVTSETQQGCQQSTMPLLTAASVKTDNYE
jgi:hypothetical protein